MLSIAVNYFATPPRAAWSSNRASPGSREPFRLRFEFSDPHPKLLSDLGRDRGPQNVTTPLGFLSEIARVRHCWLPRVRWSSLAAEHDLRHAGSSISSRLEKHMPLRQEVRFLRERAQRLRQMAEAHQTALSDQLQMMAYELEARADELERARVIENGGPSSSSS
jgi:hypothetical protein